MGEAEGERLPAGKSRVKGDQKIWRIAAQCAGDGNICTEWETSRQGNVHGTGDGVAVFRHIAIQSEEGGGAGNIASGDLNESRWEGDIRRWYWRWFISAAASGWDQEEHD